MFSNDLEKETKKLLQQIYKNVEELNKDKHIPHRSRFIIDDISSKVMSLWLVSVKKQTWGAVSGAEIKEKIE